MASRFRTLGLTVLGLALVLALSAGAWAQGTAEISGMVTDPGGAVLPKVPVKIVNVGTGVTHNTETTAAGVYRFAELPIGTYTLTVEAKGFRTYKATNLVASVGLVLAHNVHMQVGTTTETVEVNASVQMVQTTESQISQLIDHRVWDSMPNNTRDANSFLNLVAGAVPDDQAGSTRGAAINGARGGTGNFLVEGIDNNDQGQGGRGQLGDTAGGAITSISPDAIQEYRVITNSFSAEYGKAGGFVTDTVLKSGTNKFHGSLFEYNRVQALAANSFFSNRTEDPANPGHKLQDRLVRNQFGGSIGGPVIKDKTFFFTSAEIHRRRTTSPLSAVAVNPAFMDWVNGGGLQTWAESDPNGICNNQALWDYYFPVATTGTYAGQHASGWRTAAPCPGAFNRANTVGSLFKKLIADSPFPLAPATANVATSGQGRWDTRSTYPMSPYGDIVLGDPSLLNEHRVSGKVDHKFSDSDQVSGIVLLQRADSGSKFDGGGNTVGPAYTNDGVSLNVGANWNHSFSPTVLNTFRASYLRHRSDYPETAPGMPEIYTWYDSLSVGLGMYGGLPQYFTDNQFQFQDHLSFVKGKHSFKAGAEYRRTRNGSQFFNANKGGWYPYSVQDLLTDFTFGDQFDAVASTGYVRVNPSTGVTSPYVPRGSLYYATASVDLTTKQAPDPYRGFRANEFAFYFQDDWRISNRLTVNWGVRYEYFGPPHNFKENIDSNFYFGSATAIPTCATGQTTGCNASTNPNFPRNNPFYGKVFSGSFQTRNNEIWNKDTNNLGPRFGLSWDMLGNQKLVMRVGGGIMYDRIFNNVFENIRFNPPHFSVNTIGYVQNGVAAGMLSSPEIFTYPFTSNPVFAAGRAGAVNPRHMDQNTVSPYYEQLHFGFQYEFAKGYVFEPYYIGTFGHKLMAYRDINTYNGRLAASDTSRINTAISADNYRSNDYSSNYHGMQLTLRKAYSNGLQFNSSYTWSKAMDTISDLFNSRYAATVSDTMNIKADYGPADFDMRQRFVTSLSYDLPFMKNSRWLGGWGVNTIISIQSGVPFTPYSSDAAYDLNKNGLSTDRIVPVAGMTPMGTLRGVTQPTTPAWGDTVAYFDPNGWMTPDTIGYYSCPASVNGGAWCNPPIGRNSMTGPAYQNVDFGVTKKFKVNERMAFQFQANFFNLFNHTNFGLPGRNWNSGTFGQITSAYDNRQTQLALRFDF